MSRHASDVLTRFVGLHFRGNPLFVLHGDVPDHTGESFGRTATSVSRALQVPLISTMGLGAGMTVVVAVWMALIFLPEALDAYDWLAAVVHAYCCCSGACTRLSGACTRLSGAWTRLSDACTRLPGKLCSCCRCAPACTWLSDKLCAYRYIGVVASVVYVGVVAGAGTYVFVHFGMERGIGFLPTLPRDTVETTALKRLEDKFGPGPVSSQGTAPCAARSACVHACRCSPSSSSWTARGSTTSGTC